MASAFFALALTGRLEMPTILIFAAAISVSCYRVIRRLPALLSTRSAFFLSLSYIFIFVFDFSALSRSFISACIHLVLFLQVEAQEKTDCDYFYLIALSFIQVLAASSLTVDMSFVDAVSVPCRPGVDADELRYVCAERENSEHANAAAIPLVEWLGRRWIIPRALFSSSLFRVWARVTSHRRIRSRCRRVHRQRATRRNRPEKLSDAVVGHARQISGTPFALLKWRGSLLIT
jgi:hypothetical protein